MRTETINIYTFEELSEEAQENAIAQYVPFTDNIYDEVNTTVEEFHNVFGTKEGAGWTDVRTGHIDDDIAGRGKIYVLQHCSCY